MEWYMESFRVMRRNIGVLYIVTLVAASASPVPQISIGQQLGGDPGQLRAGRVIQSQPQPQFIQPQPQRIQPQPQAGQTQQRFLPGLFQVPQTNPNQNLANTGAAAGFGGIVGVAGVNCLFNNNCDLNFRPSLGASLDANGNIKPQLGITTQVGKGELAPTFTGGLQLDSNSQNGVGTFVGAGLNNGNEGGIGVGAQTGFGFSTNQNGQTQATAQLGGNVQAPSVGGVNFGQQGRPGAIGGAQPHFLGNPFLSGLFQG